MCVFVCVCVFVEGYVGARIFEGYRVVMVTTQEMDMITRVLDKAIYISHNANSYGESMNPTILPLAVG